MERVVIMGPDEPGAIITSEDLPQEVTTGSGDLLQTGGNNSIMTTPLREAREAFEREYLKVQINRFSGNISRTAAFIGMEQSALHRKLKSLGLSGKQDTDA